MNISAEEDADLRDLVARALEENGVLGKIKVFYFILLFLAFTTRAGSPQQPEPITVGHITYPTLSTFPVGVNQSTRRKPTTFSRVLTILISHEDWVQVHLTED